MRVFKKAPLKCRFIPADTRREPDLTSGPPSVRQKQAESWLTALKHSTPAMERREERGWGRPVGRARGRAGRGGARGKAGRGGARGRGGRGGGRAGRGRARHRAGRGVASSEPRGASTTPLSLPHVCEHLLAIKATMCGLGVGASIGDVTANL